MAGPLSTQVAASNPAANTRNTEGVGTLKLAAAEVVARAAGRETYPRRLPLFRVFPGATPRESSSPPRGYHPALQSGGGQESPLVGDEKHCTVLLVEGLPT